MILDDHYIGFQKEKQEIPVAHTLIESPEEEELYFNYPFVCSRGCGKGIRREEGSTHSSLYVVSHQRKKAPNTKPRRFPFLYDSLIMIINNSYYK